MSLAVGTKLGPYEIIASLGAGGMGEVYRARGPRLGREVAIKVLPAYFCQDADRLRRFEQEARTAGALNHPNILAVYDIGTNDGAPYLVTELLEGGNLRERLSGGALPVRKAVECAVQIAHGLSAEHDKGIVHRDLKPENIFTCRDGRTKILDFGLAKLTAPETGDATSTNLEPLNQTGSGVVLGTAGYMSPEQVRGEKADARSDIFGFGIVLYEMLSGQRAFVGRSAADRAERYSERRSSRSAIHGKKYPHRWTALCATVWRRIRSSVFNRREIWRFIWKRLRRIRRPVPRCLRSSRKRANCRPSFSASRAFRFWLGPPDGGTGKDLSQITGM